MGSKRSRLNKIATEEAPTTPKPIHLWSSPVPEKSTTGSLNKRARRLELSTLDSNTTSGMDFSKKNIENFEKNIKNFSLKILAWEKVENPL